MKRTVNNNGITATLALKKEVAGKASMPLEEYTQFYSGYKQVTRHLG
jgi:hypothetical protein